MSAIVAMSTALIAACSPSWSIQSSQHPCVTVAVGSQVLSGRLVHSSLIDTTIMPAMRCEELLICIDSAPSDASETEYGGSGGVARQTLSQSDYRIVAAGPQVYVVASSCTDRFRRGALRGPLTLITEYADAFLLSHRSRDVLVVLSIDPVVVGHCDPLYLLHNADTCDSLLGGFLGWALPGRAGKPKVHFVSADHLEALLSHWIELSGDTLAAKSLVPEQLIPSMTCAELLSSRPWIRP